MEAQLTSKATRLLDGTGSMNSISGRGIDRFDPHHQVGVPSCNRIRMREAASGQQERGEEIGSGNWLTCLRRLYASVPPEWLPTVELVLEQTLHQMPDVTERLIESISSSCRMNWERVDGRAAEHVKPLAVERSSRWSFASGCAALDGALASMAHDLGLILLLLREARPLSACSLPLLPQGVDRCRRAEKGVLTLLRSASRCSLDNDVRKTLSDSDRTCSDAFGVGGLDDLSYLNVGNLSGPGRRRRDGAIETVRSLLSGVLRVGTGASSSRCGASSVWCGSGGAASGGQSTTEDGMESGGVASERAWQLLELSLKWLEEEDKGGNEGIRMEERVSEDVVCLRKHELASEIISVVFDAVPEARQRLLRALLSGVVDRSRGGAVCASSYLLAWETLMAQESRQHVRKIAYSRSTWTFNNMSSE